MAETGTGFRRSSKIVTPVISALRNRKNVTKAYTNAVANLVTNERF
jgi:hypothetical protein